MNGPQAVWQRAEVADAFASERAALVPQLRMQEDVVRRLFERHDHALERFLDLGCGDGIMSELLLGVAPRAEAVLVDFSEPMLARARTRLQRTGARWQAVRGDLREPAWQAALPPGPYGAAVSALAIHHLPAARKRALFAEIFELLEPGAMFVNMDYVSVQGPLRGLFDEQMLANAVHAEHEHGGKRSAEQVARDLFDDGDEDRPDSVQDQLQWLRAAGFRDTEVHFKWAEAAVFGAIKPTAEGATG
jgi:SAM-dependent methyltransferase